MVDEPDISRSHRKGIRAKQHLRIKTSRRRQLQCFKTTGFILTSIFFLILDPRGRSLLTTNGFRTQMIYFSTQTDISFPGGAQCIHTAYQNYAIVHSLHAHLEEQFKHGHPRMEFLK